MNKKIRKITSFFPQLSIDALVVTKDINISYLTDFSASDSWLFITPKQAFYITDSRYTLEAKQGLKGVSVKEYKTSLSDMLFQLAKESNVKKLGYDEHSLTVAQFNSLKAKAPKTIKFTAANSLVEQLREIKTGEEVLKIRKALKIHHEALKYLKRIIKPGLTEWQVFQKLEVFVRQRQAGFSFPPIIASGPNSCYPHARVSRRKIRNNEPVLIDIGIDYNGYKSDLTRMFFLGKIPTIVQRANDCVYQAQQEAIKIIKPGVKVADVDFAARNYLGKYNLAQYFGHSLGHGVGLEIHEAPRLSQKNASTLKAGMIVTVEPGVYIPNKFGIRIEDMILVTKKGCEVLSDHID